MTDPISLDDSDRRFNDVSRMFLFKTNLYV